MSIPLLTFSRIRLAATALALAALPAALPAALQAQAAPKYLITATTTLATPTGFGGPNGNLATDQFGNLFVPNAAASQVLEFPANGGAPIVIFDATKTAPQVAGVAVDASNNLYVTTRYDGAISGSESDIFKFPYTSNGYPAPYIYAGASAGVCTALSTSVCNYGNYLQTAGYYYQPQAIGYDAAGNGYLLTTYDSLSGGGKTIYACNLDCGNDKDSATIAVATLPTKATSLAVAPNGDLYWADGADVYRAQAGTGKPVIFDKSYESSFGGAAGVGFDRAGNLLVTNSAGTFEVPLVGGAIIAANKFQVAFSTVGGYTGAAVDNSGNVFTAAYGSVLKSSLFNYDFGPLAVGATAAPQTFTINFLSAGTLTSLTALQGGVAAAEFPFTQGTCAPAAYNAGDSCTFTAGFAPTTVGSRRATVVMTDATGVKTNVYLVGAGQGSGVAIDPGTPTVVTSTLKAPSGMAVDAAGNLFVADPTAKAVYEYVAGTGLPVTIGSGFTRPTGVAADGAGNLYVVDQGTGILSTFISNAGTYLKTSTGTVIASGLTAPSDVVISGTGSLYVSNTGANTIQQYPNVSRIGSLATTLALGINLKGPTGLSLDPSGNLYIADTGNNRVLQLGYNGAQLAFGSGLNAPTGVSAEPSGSVLIADQGNGRIVRVPNEAGTLASADQVVLSQPILNPYAIRLTASGNLYVSDNSVGTIEVLQRTAGTLNFGFSNLNTPTTAQSIVVSNTGTTSLPLASPFFTQPPANFTVASGSGSTGCTSGTLTTGRDCILTSVFNPGSLGTKTYTEALNTAVPNAAAPSIMLIGQGVQLTTVAVTLAQTTPTGTVTYGVPVTLTATVASSGSGSTTVPAGSIIFNVDGQNTKPVTLSATGTAAYTLSGLAGGSKHTVIATYQGSSVYASGNSTAYTFNVVPATTTGVLTVSAIDLSPLSANVGDSVSFNVIITPSIVVSGGLTGSVTFTAGTHTFSSPIQQNSTTGVFSAGISTTILEASCKPGEQLPNCSNIYQIVASFAGNGNYTGFTLSSQPLIITPPTFSVVASNTTITSTATQYGTANLLITSYDNFQAGVSLTCSGLPANAYCIFRPGIISLTYVPNGTTLPIVYTIPAQTTQMQIRVSQDPVTIQSASSFGLLGLLCGIALFATGVRKGGRRNLRGLLTCCLIGLTLALGMGSLSGCGSSSSSSSSFPTPAGTYNITLNEIATPLAGTQAPNTSNITSILPCATVALAYKTMGNAITCSSPTSYVIQTATSSGLSALQIMTISGVTPAGFNGNFKVLQDVGESNVAANNVITNYYDLVEFEPTTVPTANGTGGVVRLANFTNSQTFTLIVK